MNMRKRKRERSERYSTLTVAIESNERPIPCHHAVHKLEYHDTYDFQLNTTVSIQFNSNIID